MRYPFQSLAVVYVLWYEMWPVGLGQTQRILTTILSGGEREDIEACYVRLVRVVDIFCVTANNKQK